MPLSVGIFVLFVILALATLVVWLARAARRADEAANWPISEGTIQSVGKVVINSGRSAVTVDVGDFSYVVNNEYYSGRLRISNSFSNLDGQPRNLIHQRVQVQYDPQEPDKFSVPQQEVGGFLLDSYRNVESFATDIDPIDLNIDKI
jgi:hypothetical protein